MSTLASIAPQEVGHGSPNALPIKNEEQAPTDRHRRTLAVVDALKRVRECLTDADCQSVAAQMRHIIFAAARDIAEAIGTERYDGMTVYEEDGALELLVDNFRESRTLAVAVNPGDCHVQLRKITPGGVTRGPWTRRAYDLESHVAWLLKRKDAES